MIIMLGGFREEAACFLCWARETRFLTGHRRNWQWK